MSPITKEQWTKVLKSLVYSFAAGFTGTLVLVSANIIQAADSGTAGVISLSTAVISAGVIGGINAVFVTIKQLLTPA